jgi:hypothetical protein
MPDTIHTLARRALAAAAVVVVIGAAACSESPTAPGAAPRARAGSSLAKQQANKAGAARRGGYNVVAD